IIGAVLQILINDLLNKVFRNDLFLFHEGLSFLLAPTGFFCQISVILAQESFRENRFRKERSEGRFMV
ncbi:MAG: hypothetical protein IIY36_03735, partial [Lachnospiraceae bacterium]|nr:hypothetical protein [Lachnospiraceae bacterium]